MRTYHFPPSLYILNLYERITQKIFSKPSEITLQAEIRLSWGLCHYEFMGSSLYRLRRATPGHLNIFKIKYTDLVGTKQLITSQVPLLRGAPIGYKTSHILFSFLSHFYFFWKIVAIQLLFFLSFFFK